MAGGDLRHHPGHQRGLGGVGHRTGLRPGHHRPPPRLRRARCRAFGRAGPDHVGRGRAMPQAPIGDIARARDHPSHVRHCPPHRPGQVVEMEIRIIHVEQDRPVAIEPRPVQRVPRALHQHHIRRGAGQNPVALRQRQARRDHQGLPAPPPQFVRHVVDAQKRRPTRPVGGQQHDPGPPAPPLPKRLSLHRDLAHQTRGRAQQRPDQVSGRWKMGEHGAKMPPLVLLNS